MRKEVCERKIKLKLEVTEQLAHKGSLRLSFLFSVFEKFVKNVQETPGEGGTGVKCSPRAPGPGPCLGSRLPHAAGRLAYL